MNTITINKEQLIMDTSATQEGFICKIFNKGSVTERIQGILNFRNTNQLGIAFNNREQALTTITDSFNKNLIGKQDVCLICSRYEENSERSYWTAVGIGNTGDLWPDNFNFDETASIADNDGIIHLLMKN